MEHDGLFTFGIYIISAGRASIGPVTAKNFEYYTHVVKKSEEADYAANGFENIWAVEDGLIDGYASVFNFLVDNAREDAIAIVDDDIEKFEYREADKSIIEDPGTVTAELERLAQMLVDLGIGLAFGPPTDNPKFYREEFSWTGMPGAFKIINREKIKARMDPKVDRNVDVDYVLQETLANRICLSAKWLCTKDYKFSGTNTTGSTYSMDDVNRSLELMKVRWGRYISYSNNIVKIMVER